MNELISVIIPAYNAYRTLARAIDSVVAQTYAHKEIILVDDGSTDNTALLLKSAYPDVTYIKINHTGLPGVVRNEGIKRASGTLIAFLDADDYWDESVLKELAGCFARDEKIGLAYGCLEYVGGELDGKQIQDFRTPFSGQVFEKMIENNFIPMHPALVKKEAFEKVNGFDSTIRMAEDYDLWIRVSYLYPVAYNPGARGYYCISQKSMFHQTDLFERNMYLYKIMTKIRTNCTVNSAVLWKRLAVICLTLCHLAFLRWQGAKMVRYAFMTVWFSIRYYGKRLV